MRWFVLLCVLAFATPASAVTLQEVVLLSKSGVSEGVILALIERDQSVFAISAEQLVNLRRQGVSDTVLLAMLKSGKADQPAPAPPVLATTVTAPLPYPDVAIVGHGPERPNTLSDYERPFGGLMSIPYPLPYFVSSPGTYFAPSRGRFRHRSIPVAPQFEPPPQPFCVSTTHAGVPPALSPITECSPVIPQAPFRR